jgi:hypothetical protein
MALLSTLVKVIADVGGMDEAFVSGIARYLREAGLISQAGRGRGAAHMTARDASNAIIGVNACSMAKDAPTAVSIYGALRALKPSIQPEEGTLHTICTEGINFGEALELLVRAHVPDQNGLLPIDGELFGEVDWPEGSPEYDRTVQEIEKQIAFEIEFIRPSSEASIRVYQVAARATVQADLTEPEDRLIAAARFSARKAQGHKLGDRRDQTTITRRTLLAVGQVLAT